MRRLEERKKKEGKKEKNHPIDALSVSVDLEILISTAVEDCESQNPQISPKHQEFLLFRVEKSLSVSNGASAGRN